MYRKARRRVEWDEHVKVTVLKEIDKYPRLYEVIKHFEWLLERQPDNNFAKNLGEGYWLIVSESLPLRDTDIPRVRLVYKFNDQVVYFWGIKIDPPPKIDYSGT